MAEELREADSDRVRWLSTASRDAALQICADPSPADPAEVHCARFAVHLALSVRLPEGYAWEVLRAWEHSEGRDVYTAPLEGHVRMMAMCAADLDRVVPIPTELLTSHDPFLGHLVLFRLAHAPQALDDECLLELSSSNVEGLRGAVVGLFNWRQSQYRNQILTRLINDPCRSVSDAACLVAGRTREPDLLDLLATKGDLFALCLGGDSRGRPHVEALSSSEDARCRKEAVAMALLLRDRNVLVRLWNDREWEVRRCAILDSAQQGFMEGRQLDSILAQESPDHVAELILKWPRNDAETLSHMGQILFASVDGSPSVETVAEGRADALNRARAWIPTRPELSGSVMRLLPHDTAVILAHELLASSEVAARAVATSVVAFRGLTECFPNVAELCVDPNDTVAEEAARAIRLGRMRCGIYGLDTAILRARDNFGASVTQRYCMRDLAEIILVDNLSSEPNGLST